jgi:hypothetical protein
VAAVTFFGGPQSTPCVLNPFKLAATIGRGALTPTTCQSKRATAPGTCIKIGRLGYLLSNSSYTQPPTMLERIQSPRPNTPEVGAQQGHRNTKFGVQLLDADGSISVEVCPSMQYAFSCAHFSCLQLCCFSNRIVCDLNSSNIALNIYLLNIVRHLHRHR